MPIKRTADWHPDDDEFVAPCGGDSSSDDEGEDDLDAVTPAGSGERLSELLLAMLYSGGKMSAQRLCIIAYWAQRAGAVGVESLAFAPGKQTGAYQKHLDSMLGTKPKNMETYKLPLPRYLKSELCRSVVDEDVLLPQQAALLASCTKPQLDFVTR